MVSRVARSQARACRIISSHLPIISEEITMVVAYAARVMVA
jgi:hypothetical protein